MTFVIAKSEAAESRMSLFSAAARSAVRYADPMSWTAATAVGQALANLNGAVADLRRSIGVITLSEHGPAQAIAAVAEASAAGFSSPMRYPAANPGSLAGVVCITHELRGPTMNFTMPPALAIPAASALAGAWIERRRVPLLVLLASTRIAADKYLARCLLLADHPFDRKPADPMTAAHANWLTSTHE
jgi:hypothetical protein